MQNGDCLRRWAGPPMAPTLWEGPGWYFQDKSLMSLNISLHKLLAVHWLGAGMVVLRAGARGNRPDFPISGFWDWMLRTWPPNSSTCFQEPPEIVPWLLLKLEGVYPYLSSTITLRPLTHSGSEELLLSKLRYFSPITAHKSLCLFCPGGPSRPDPAG